MSKFARTALSAAVASLGLAVASQSQAAVVYLNMADIHAPIGGIMGFNGAAMQSLPGQDDLRVSVGAAVFPNAHLVTTAGWAIAPNTTLIADRDFSGTISAGDSITANIGPSTFDIVNADGVLVHGSFTNAVLNTAVGSTSVNINSANANGLDLSPGAVLVGLGYPDFGPAESLGISLVNINPGVAAIGAPIPATPFFLGNMLPFGIGQATPSSGSVDMVANLVPEPTSLGLLGLGALGLIARRRRFVSGKLLAAALAAGAMTFTAAQSHAAVMYMDISDIHAPISGIAGYNGAALVDLGGIDDFVVTGVGVFPNAHFVINSGFAVTSTAVGDANFNNIPDPGETITSLIGPGTFSVVNPSGVIVMGSFGGATLSSSVGSSSVTVNAGDTNGLDLLPGPVLTGLGVVDLVDPESFGLNIVGIAPGVSVTPTVPVAPGLFLATLNPFAINQNPPTSGSVNLVADAVVPEPASIGLLSIAGLGLAARRRRA